MNTNNNTTPAGFVLDHVVWGAMALYLYKCFLFCPLGRSTVRQSQLILILLVASCSLLGGVFQIKRQRNGYHIFFNLMIGLGAYTVLAYWPVRPLLIRTVLVAVAVLSALYALFALAQKYAPAPASGKRKRRIFLRRLRRVAAVAQALLAVGCAVILGVIASPLVVGNAVLSAGVSPAASDVQEQTIANHMDTILLLQQEQWQQLTVDQKLDVLQTVANIECRYLGIPHELNVGIAPAGEDIYGFYVDPTYEVVLSMASLLNDPAEDILDTVCHEAYHSYQHCLVDVYDALDAESRELRLFRQAAAYREEFQNYSDGEEGAFSSYYDQACESDARAYAADAVRDYYSRIEEYLCWQEDLP